MQFPRIATGSIVIIASPGSRASDGEPYDLPAIVLAQNEEDGMLTLFCFHFEGQYQAIWPPVIQDREAYIDPETKQQAYRFVEKPNVRVVFDAALNSVKSPVAIEIPEWLNRFCDIEQKIARFEESGLFEPSPVGGKKGK